MYNCLICSQIEMDFISLYPDKKSIFFDEWRKHKNQIMQIAIDKVRKNEKKQDMMTIFSVEEGN